MELERFAPQGEGWHALPVVVLWGDCFPVSPTCFDVVFFSFAGRVIISQPGFRFL